MINNFNTDLYNNLTKQGAEIIHYLVFHFPTGDRYLSDRPYITRNANTCEVLVYEWGTITSSVSLDNAVKSIQIPITQFSVSILNTENTGWFCSVFSDFSIENTEVSLYITEKDASEEYFIDTFIISNPITFSESSVYVSFDLISKITLQNKFVGSIDPATNNFYPLVIGSAQITEGVPYGNQPIAKVIENVAINGTVVKTDRNLVTAGFTNPSGTVSIGLTTFTYTGISGNDFTGVSGIESVLLKDTWICKDGADITFAFGSGPVEIANPIYVNNAVYTNPATIYKNVNPVRVTFPGSLPYEYVPDDYNFYRKWVYFTITNSFYPFDNVYGLDFSIVSGVMKTKQLPSALYEKNIYCTDVILETIESIKSEFPQNLIDYGISIIVTGNLYGFAGNSSTSKGFAAFRVLINGYTHATYSDWNSTAVPIGIDADINSSTDLSVSIGVVGFNQIASSATYYKFADDVVIKLTYWYTEGTPGTPYKKYFGSVSLNIGSSTGSSDPATAIKSFINSQSPKLLIDEPSFNYCKNWFQANNYTFSGKIEGDKDYLTAIKELLFQSRSFLTFKNNKVFLNIANLPQDNVNKFLSLEESRFEKSITIDRQSLDDVYNKMIVKYNSNDTQFLNVIEVSDQNSIEKIGSQETVLEFSLVKTSAHAQNLADFYMSNSSVPKTIITFSENSRKMLCEVGDAVVIFTSFSNINVFLGTVIRIEKQFTSENSVSTYKFTIVGKLENNKIVENIISQAETMISTEITPITQNVKGFDITPWGYSWGF